MKNPQTFQFLNCNQSLENQITKTWQPCWWNLLLSSTNIAAMTSIATQEFLPYPTAILIPLRLFSRSWDLCPYWWMLIFGEVRLTRTVHEDSRNMSLRFASYQIEHAQTYSFPQVILAVSKTLQSQFLPVKVMKLRHGSNRCLKQGPKFFFAHTKPSSLWEQTTLESRRIDYQQSVLC